MGKVPLLCPRCTGFYIGVATFTLLVALFHFLGVPKISITLAHIFLIIGILSFLPTALHGISRRYFNKDLSPKASLNLLYLSGFLTAAGGFLVGWALITLNPLSL